jgi:formate hydrogenlyase subunit 6/NADH:ubiquinone oxidoreductase subunit I
VPRAVLDSSAQILFLTEMFRGMSLTLKYFFEPKVTVSRCSQNALAFARLRRGPLRLPRALRSTTRLRRAR